MRVEPLIEPKSLEEYRHSLLGSEAESGGLRAKGVTFEASAKPVISVITAVRNSESLLEGTLDSILSQEYERIEVIVVDGRSTDSTLEIVKKYGERISYWISEPDQGIADAMNKGVALASGEIITFLNAGDRYVDDGTLQFVADWFFSEKWIWAFGLAKLMVGYQETNFSQKFLAFHSWHYYYKTPNCHQATFFARGVFDQVGLHFLGNAKVFDVDFFIRCSKVAKPAQATRFLVWYDTTGVSASIGLKAIRSRLMVTARHSSGVMTSVWGALVWLRWARSVVGAVVKHALILFRRLRIGHSRVS